MGLRSDLDSIKLRYIYTLSVDNIIVYVGTTSNPKTRLSSHIKRINTDKALLYRYLKAKKKQPKMTVVFQMRGTYAEAEKKEIELIVKYSDTCLNFYNNPNKENYKRLMSLYI